MKIKFKEDRSDTSVRVDNKSTASLTALADSTRSLRDREFKILVKLVNEYRKADRHADKWTNLDELILGARTLSNREWKQAVKFAKTLFAKLMVNSPRANSSRRGQNKQDLSKHRRYKWQVLKKVARKLPKQTRKFTERTFTPRLDAKAGRRAIQRHDISQCTQRWQKMLAQKAAEYRDVAKPPSN